MATYCTAAAKIANLCVQAYQELPEELTVEFPSQSPLASTDPGAQSNLAFLNGLLGLPPESPEGIRIASEKGVHAQYKVGDFPCHPDYPATVKLTLDKGKKHYFFYGACTGEGDCLIYEFDRCPTVFHGESYDLLVFIEIWAAGQKESMIQEIQGQLEGVQKVDTSTNGTCWLMTFHCGKPAAQELIEELNTLEHVQLAEQLVPVSF